MPDLYGVQNMRKIKLICQIVIAFIIASLAYSIIYEPHQDAVRSVIRKQLYAAEQQFSKADKKQPAVEKQVPAAEEKSVQPQGELRITVLDVGQGDAILLQDGKQNIMVDVGDGRNQALLEQRLAEAGVKRVNTVIVTHHHEDHMGNILKVAGKYSVSRILDNGYVNEKNTTSVKLNDILRKGNYKNRVLKAGDTIKFGNDLYFEVLSPGDFVNPKLLKNLNNTSLVMKLHYGNFSMLFTGDAEKGVEALLAEKYGDELKSDVLKVGHHGSRTASIYRFISKVKPAYALISCGTYEKYHHPNENVVGSLEHLGAKVYTTHNSGNLTVITDGQDYTLSTAR